MYLLIVYDLDTGRTRRMKWYDDSRTARWARFAAEYVEPGRTEIIVLGGTVEAMKRTHSKYFARGERPATSV